MAGARFPVDPAAVHPRLIFGERFEHGAFAANAPRDQAELRFSAVSETTSTAAEA